MACFGFVGFYFSQLGFFYLEAFLGHETHFQLVGLEFDGGVEWVEVWKVMMRVGSAEERGRGEG